MPHSSPLSFRYCFMRSILTAWLLLAWAYSYLRRRTILSAIRWGLFPFFLSASSPMIHAPSIGQSKALFLHPPKGFPPILFLYVEKVWGVVTIALPAVLPVRHCPEPVALAVDDAPFPPYRGRSPAPPCSFYPLALPPE